MAKSQWTKAEPKGLPLIEIVCLVLEEAAQKVIRNKGAAGVDGITFEDLSQFLEKHGEKIKQKLRNGTTYRRPSNGWTFPNLTAEQECWEYQHCLTAQSNRP